MGSRNLAPAELSRPTHWAFLSNIPPDFPPWHIPPAKPLLSLHFQLPLSSPLIQTPNTAWSSMELSWNHQEFRRQRGWCTKTTLKWKLSEICIYSHSQPWQHNIKLQQGGRKQELSSVLIAPSAGFKNRLGQSCRKPSWRLLFLIIFFFLFCHKKLLVRKLLHKKAFDWKSLRKRGCATCTYLVNPEQAVILPWSLCFRGFKCTH